MTDLKTRILDATKAAMKARDKVRVGTLRLVNAEMKRLEVDEHVDPLEIVALRRQLPEPLLDIEQSHLPPHDPSPLRPGPVNHRSVESAPVFGGVQVLLEKVV